MVKKGFEKKRLSSNWFSKWVCVFFFFGMEYTGGPKLPLYGSLRIRNVYPKQDLVHTNQLAHSKYPKKHKRNAYKAKAVMAQKLT